MAHGRKKIIAVGLLACLIGLFFWAYRFGKAHQHFPRLMHSIKHLAIITDGNRRWAHQQGLKVWQGHESGIEADKIAIEFCLKQGIPYLTLYTFSLENFDRSAEELEHIFALIKKKSGSPELHNLLQKHGVKVRFVGDRNRFPADLVQAIDDLEQKTASGTNLSINIMFCYGGQQEIAAAMQKIGEKIAKGELKPEAITPELITQHLWMGDVPCPDLILRTSEQRLSNFLTWQCGYGELMFLDCYWPDITTEHLANAVKEFETRKRRFGK